MNSSYLNHIVRFVFLLLLQGLVLDKISFFDGRMLPFPYIYALLILPFNTAKWLFLIIGFVYGFAIDSFSSTLGMHTSATVFLAFIIPYFRDMLAPIEGYGVVASPTVESQGVKWFLIYILVLTFLHHTWLFYIESFQITNFFATLLKIILSTIFSVILMLIFHFLPLNLKKRKK